MADDSFPTLLYNNSMTCTFLIGGDVYPVDRQYMARMLGDSTWEIFDFLSDEFRQADFSIVNLETPLTARQGRPILKDGPIFSVEPDFAKILANAGIKAASLANNHMMDHGVQGLQSTLDALDASGLRYTGAGENLAQASQLLIVENDGLKVGLLGMADREFSIAGADSWGANPTDLIAFRRKMKKEGSGLEHLIVLLHEGTLYYPYPSPRLLDLCHFLVEEGASAVICQHSHCPGSYEVYQGALIVYGQGDLIGFDRSPQFDPHGFLVKLVLDAAGVNFEIIPYGHTQGVIRKLDEAEKEQFIARLAQRSANLQDAQFLRASWEALCLSRMDEYWGRLAGYGLIMRAMNQVWHIARYISPQKTANLLNLVRCAAHREILETMLEHLYRKGA
jgi:poly-gamma-glutamate capsule biosynthesis protein CapA/YwtB (metallophosphatase superfamily)